MPYSQASVHVDGPTIPAATPHVNARIQQQRLTVCAATSVLPAVRLLLLLQPHEEILPCQLFRRRNFKHLQYLSRISHQLGAGGILHVDLRGTIWSVIDKYVWYLHSAIVLGQR